MFLFVHANPTRTNHFLPAHDLKAAEINVHALLFPQQMQLCTTPDFYILSFLQVTKNKSLHLRCQSKEQNAIDRYDDMQEP